MKSKILIVKCVYRRTRSVIYLTIPERYLSNMKDFIKRVKESISRILTKPISKNTSKARKRILEYINNNNIKYDEKNYNKDWNVKYLNDKVFDNRSEAFHEVINLISTEAEARVLNTFPNMP